VFLLQLDKYRIMYVFPKSLSEEKDGDLGIVRKNALKGRLFSNLKASYRFLERRSELPTLFQVAGQEIMMLTFFRQDRGNYHWYLSLSWQKNAGTLPS